MLSHLNLKFTGGPSNYSKAVIQQKKTLLESLTSIINEAEEGYVPHKLSSTGCSQTAQTQELYHKEKCANHSVNWGKWVTFRGKNVCMKALNDIVNKLNSETSNSKILFSYIQRVETLGKKESRSTDPLKKLKAEFLSN